MSGKQVRLFLVDGEFGGLKTAEIMNWTGHILVGKRKDLDRIRRRPEAARPGVYVLFGESDAGEHIAYIGQSDAVGKRLAQHEQSVAKSFWTGDVVLITSKDQNLTSAHVRYLESRLIQLAHDVGRVPLDNANVPTGGAELPEADASDMQYFIEQVRVLMPVLGFDIFRGRAARPAGSAATAPAPTASPVFRTRSAKRRVDARAQVVDGEFTVLEGSLVAASMPENLAGTRQYASRQQVHADLVNTGAIERLADGTAKLTRDVVFSSPSAAAATVHGMVAMNGRSAWATAESVTFNDWESTGTAAP